MKTTCCLLLWFLCLMQPAVAETRIFELRHRSAGELAVTVQDALGGGVKVIPAGHSLVVSAPDEELALVTELIARLDRPLRMLRVYVAQNQAASASGIDVSGAVVARSGDAAVILGRQPAAVPRSGGGVVVSGDHGSISAAGNAGGRSEARRVEQFLVTLEGVPARISVGSHLPVTERWLALACRHLKIVESTRYESVDTGFEVIPEILPSGQIALTIHPFMAFSDPQHLQEIRFSELSTRVTIPVDSWFDLAGTMSTQDEVSREILGMAGHKEEGSGGVRVRVELQPN